MDVSIMETKRDFKQIPGIGDLVVIFDNQVWVRNWCDNHENEFVRAIYSPEFVRINPNIFDKL